MLERRGSTNKEMSISVDVGISRKCLESKTDTSIGMAFLRKSHTNEEYQSGGVHSEGRVTES